MTAPGEDDVTRDAWLREALRHAPDAAMAPPADVSQAILRAAQAHTRPVSAPARRRPGWGQRLWMWLAQPAVGAGLATVMIGSVVGTMWWDRPLPEPDSPPRESVARAPASPPPPPVASPAPRESADTVATAPTTAPAAEARKREAAPAVDNTLRRPTPTTTRPEPEARAAAGAAAGSTQPAPPPPAPAMAANDAVTQAARTADAMVPAAPALALPELAAAAPASRPARRPLAKSGAAERLATADMQARFAAPDRAFVAMRLALSAEAQRWTWRRDRGPEQPIGDALTGWLAELDAAAASHWAPAPPVRASEPSSSVQLLREGRVMHTLQLGAGEVRWDATDTDGSTGESRVAALEPQRALALRQALSRIAP